MSVNTATERQIQLSISWVKPELDIIIQEVKDSLEQYGNDLNNFEPLLPTLEKLKLMRGTFHMLEFYGAALLIEDMERSVRSLLARLAAKPEDAFEALVQATMALSGYLDRLYVSPNDVPLVLLPIVNDLRAARNEPLLTESSLFLPNLSIVPRLPDDILLDETKEQSLSDTANALRPYFHAALLTWYRNPKDSLSLQQIKLVIRNLESSAMTPRLRQLWWIAGGPIEALIDKGLRTNVSIRLLLGQLDRYLKLVAAGRYSEIEKNPPFELLKNFLFYTAHAQSQGERIATLKKAYSLEKITLNENDVVNLQENMRSPKSETFTAIARELNKSLSSIKTLIDSYVRGQNRSILSGLSKSLQSLDKVLQPLKHVADTLSLMNLGKERHVLVKHISQFEKQLSSDTVNRDDLMALASAILHTESIINNIGNERRVENMPGNFTERRRRRDQLEKAMDAGNGTPINRIPDTEYRLMTQQAAGQAKENIVKVKNQIMTFLSNSKKRNSLENIPALLNEVRGSLIITGHPFAADLTKGLIAFTQETILQSEEIPESTVLDHFAEAVVGLEYFLEAIANGRSQLHTVLAITRENLAAIGHSIEEPKSKEKRHPALESVVTHINDAKLLKENNSEKKPLFIPVDIEQPDDELKEIFSEEANEEIDNMGKQLVALKSNINDRKALAEIRHVFHTLKGSGRIAGASDISEFAAAIEEYLNRVNVGAVKLEARGLKLLVDAYEVLYLLLNSFQNDTPAPLKTNGIIQEIMSLTEILVDIEEEESVYDEPLTQQDMSLKEDTQVTIKQTVQQQTTDQQVIPTLAPLDGLDDKLLNLAEELQSHIDYYLENSDNDPQAVALLETIEKIHTLSVENEESSEFTQTTSLLFRYISNIINNGGIISLETLDILQEYCATMFDLLSTPLENENQSTPREELVDATQIFESTAAPTLTPDMVEPMTGISNAIPDVTVHGNDVRNDYAEKSEIDDEDLSLIDIFIDEAQDLLRQSNDLITQWTGNKPQGQQLNALQRALHTLKGSARMAGVSAIGHIAHAAESVLEKLVEQDAEITTDFIGIMHNALDAVNDIIVSLQNEEEVHVPVDLINEINSYFEQKPESTEKTINVEEALTPVDETTIDAAQDDEEAIHEQLMEAIGEAVQGQSIETVEEISPEQRTENLEETIPEQIIDTVEEMLTEEIIEETATIIPSPETNPEPTPEQPSESTLEQSPVLPRQTESVSAQKSPAVAAGEPIRLTAELVDRLVDTANTESELITDASQNINRIQSTLSEMDIAINRLQAQLRDFEFGEKGARPTQSDNKDIDLSDFTEEQQTAQRLMENVGDIENLHSNLTRLSIETEGFINHQSKIHAELSDDLIRSRMTAFVDQSQRMQRVVRQSCRELGKKVTLKQDGFEGAIDRSLLDHLMGPFEHLLRNAIAHGIETPEQRLSEGKPDTGVINFTFDKDGSELVFTLSDDGTGINLTRIREKAIEKGLIKSTEELNDDQLIQFIFEPGFSTSEEVSQLSGRGIGMDVVASEIQNLGGEILVHTEAGQGSTFIIRVPYTATLNKTLLVRSANTVYAFPHNMIETSLPIDRNSLREAYQKDRPSLEIGNSEYPLWHLNTLLNNEPPKLPENNKVSYILLVRSNRLRMAVQVDEIIDTKDTMVKSTGTQLGKIPGIAGATILNNGEVALIADVPALVRMATTKEVQHFDFTQQTDTHQAPCIMVVDDSITVRKVSERFLNRNGYTPILAKDGMEALEILEHTKPGLFLLDIEMPRMDGLELSRRIRQHPAHSKTPIIMITSRTGKVHRQAADEAGVDIFLGKPYQENQLLSYIVNLLEKKETATETV